METAPSSRPSARGRRSFRWLSGAIASGCAVAFMPSLGGCQSTSTRTTVAADRVHDIALSSHGDPEGAWRETIAEAAFDFVMVPIPGSDDGKIKPFFMSQTELTWDAFDVFVFRLDIDPSGSDWSDVDSRPTKPYLPPDRGYGHEGYAAISLTHRNASQFCVWMTERTGRKWRLATEDEWEHAARGGRPDAIYSFGDDVLTLGDYAWFKPNSRNTPHPVGQKKADRYGLHDMHGNVAEWVDGRDGKPVTKGGSFRDTAKWLRIDARREQDASWNASDPQIPKSPWWLSDGPFAGFRVVCEAAPAKTTNDGGEEEAAEKPADSPTKPKPNSPKRGS